MSDTASVTVLSPEAIEPAAEPTRLLPAVALLSLATLLLELALTRLFSVVLYYHFAFLAISLALLGLGAGGVFSYIFRRRLARWPTAPLCAALCLANSAATTTAVVIVLRMSVTLEANAQNLGRLTVIYIVSALPFFFTGSVFSLLFDRQRARIGQIYGADLLGGAAACLALVPLLILLGGPNVVLLAAVAMAATAALWHSRLRKPAIVWAALLLLVIVANHGGALLGVLYSKGRARNNVEFARWNALALVEVTLEEGGARYVVLDGDANTAIMTVPPQLPASSPAYRQLMAPPPAMVNLLRPRGSYAIIGPGGGVDVARAVVAGSPRILGVEINPVIVRDVMQRRYLDYSRGLYRLPQVEIRIAEGRSFLRQTNERFDVIQMTLVDTWASTAAGAFALSENNLYTVEAFREYFGHLRPDGILAVTRWEFQQPREALRVVSLARAAFGVRDASRNFIVISEGPLNTDGVPVTVLASKSGFDAAEELLVRRQLEQNPRLTALYLPSTPGENAFSSFIRSFNPASFARAYGYDVSPVSDDAPFFFLTLKLSKLLAGGEARGMDWKVNLGVLVLAAVLALSVLAVTAFLVLPLWLSAGNRPGSARLFYFVALGLGYMLVEIAFIQRFVLLLGHPTYALTVVVFLMLLASGAGSLVARRWPVEGWKLRLLPAALAAVILADALILPGLIRSLLAAPFALRLAAAAVILVPLAFFMGMPLPTGLRALAGARSDTLEWAWAMNAAASVLGSVAAISIAIAWGLTATLAAGAAAYLMASIVAGRLLMRAGSSGVAA